MAESVPNVYILEGGINNWIAMFGDDDLTKTFNSGRRQRPVMLYL